jgi:uncharacterized MAPEG superfamily protein
MSFITAITLMGLLTLMMVGFEIMFTYVTQGFAYGFSSNRPAIEKSPLGLRVQRAYENQVQSTAYIIPILAAGAFTGLTGGGVELAALLIVLGRTAFALLYYTGISFIRVPAFVLGTFPSLYIAYVLLTGV